MQQTIDMMALGYVHQDRLWQMELMRRIAVVCEIFWCVAKTIFFLD
jgi:hypothetical protein